MGIYIVLSPQKLFSTVLNIPPQSNKSQSYGTSFKTPPGDLKQNGIQEKTSVSILTVFNTFSHGLPCFVASGSSINHLQTGSLTANQKLLFHGL